MALTELEVLPPRLRMRDSKLGRGSESVPVMTHVVPAKSEAAAESGVWGAKLSDWGSILNCDWSAVMNAAPEGLAAKSRTERAATWPTS